MFLRLNLTKLQAWMAYPLNLLSQQVMFSFLPLSTSLTMYFKVEFTLMHLRLLKSSLCLRRVTLHSQRTTGQLAYYLVLSSSWRVLLKRGFDNFLPVLIFFMIFSLVLGRAIQQPMLFWRLSTLSVLNLMLVTMY